MKRNNQINETTGLFARENSMITNSHSQSNSCTNSFKELLDEHNKYYANRNTCKDMELEEEQLVTEQQPIIEAATEPIKNCIDVQMEESNEQLINQKTNVLSDKEFIEKYIKYYVSLNIHILIKTL